MKGVHPAEHWADTWKQAWEASDVEAIVSLYAVDALLSTEPFREPYRGREGVRAYVSGVFAEEEDQRVHFAEPIVDGARASVSWWASLREDGQATTLAGTSVLRFGDDGLVVEQWDTWNVTRERRQAPEDRGPFGAPTG